MKRSLYPFGFLLAAACGPSDLALPLPVFDPAIRAGLLLLQTDESPDSTVKRALAFSAETPGVLSVEADESDALRLLLYRVTLDDLSLSAGELSRPAPGAGQPLEVADLAFVSTAGDGAAWRANEPIAASKAPWELPQQPVRSRCEDVSFPSWAVPEVTLIEPSTTVAIADDEAVIGGFRTDPNTGGAAETLLLRIRAFDAQPVVDFIGEPWPADAVTSIVADGPDRLFGVTRLGRLFRVELPSAERFDLEGALTPGRGWQVARGRDGLLVVYDGSKSREGTADPETFPGFYMDPVSMALTPFQAPEPFSEIEVIDASFMIAAAQGRIYRFEGGRWEREFDLGEGVWVTDLATDLSGTRFLAVAAHTYVVERSLGGQWQTLPEVRGSFGLDVSTFLPTGEIVVGGISGVYSIWDNGAWCQPTARPFSRGLRALELTPSGNYVLSVTHSRIASESLLIARMAFSAPAD